MNAKERFALASCMDAIKAKESLEFINCVAAALNGKSSNEYRVALIDVAYEHDPAVAAAMIEGLTRCQ